MRHSLSFRRFASCVMAGTAVVCAFVAVEPVSQAADEKLFTSHTLYHADPEHLWNRLHEALFVRVGPDGRVYGQDRLEPLLWAKSKHLLEERSNRQATARSRVLE